MHSPISEHRSAQMGYHLAESEAWLAASDGGRHTTYLAYAAFELRLEIERVALELLVHIRGGKPHPDDLTVMGKFKRMEDRIYELEGNQAAMDAKVQTGNLLLELLGLPDRIPRVEVKKLSRAWHSCSELCHILWSFESEALKGAVAAKEYEELATAQTALRVIVKQGVRWARIADTEFNRLAAEYRAKRISAEEVRAWLRERGLWAQLVHPDATVEPAGEPIAPTNRS